jgi:glucose-6-phosphate isomerase
MAGAVGVKHGVTQDELAGVAARIPDAHAALRKLRESGEVAFYDLPYRRDSVDRVKALADQLAGRFDDVVVCGIGGSALGTIALRSALCHPLYNELSAEARGTPRLYVEDNVDPAGLRALLEVIDPARSLFIVISKSGSTVETMAQFLLVRSLLGGRMKDNVVAITGTEGSTLRPIAEEDCLAVLEVPEGVGGRFSVLSPVGLLPAALCGIDIDGLLAGAADADRRRCASESLDENDAYMAAAAEYILYGKGHKLSVFMPYAAALRDVADWYRQLWAESLGKNLDVGPTPIKALGVTDQHSQIQLYQAGPNDKVICFLALEDYGEPLEIPPAYTDAEALGYIGGHTFNELIEYERLATSLALTDASRPNYSITLPEVSPYAVGQLLHMLEVKTAISAQLYGVNAFDQPGVEAGKVLACGLMGRKGYEAAAQWVQGKRAGKAVPPLEQLLRKLGR